MGELLGRDATLTAGILKLKTRDPQGEDLSPRLRFAFKVVKSLTADCNTAEITIYNLSRDHRAALQEKDLPFQLEVGYVGALHQAFKGSLAFVQSTQDGRDWITKLQAGDGIAKMKKARVNISLRGPATMQQALQAVAGALGLAPGNLAAQGNGKRPSLTQFVHGLALSGKASHHLDKLAKTAGLQFSVQDEALLLLADGEVLPGAQVVLRPGTGLIGSPMAGEKGVVKVRSLLQPGLEPGKGVRVQSAQVKGTYRVEKGTYTGDTFGNDWYADLELKAL